MSALRFAGRVTATLIITATLLAALATLCPTVGNSLAGIASDIVHMLTLEES